LFYSFFIFYFCYLDSRRLGRLPSSHSPVLTSTSPLSLTATSPQHIFVDLSNRILRLKINEDPTLGPPKKHLEVPDVIVPNFSSKKLWLQRVSTAMTLANSVTMAVRNAPCIFRWTFSSSPSIGFGDENPFPLLNEFYIYIYIYIILHILPPRTLNLMLEIKVSLNSVSPFKKVGYFVDYIWSFELDLKVNVRGKVGRNEYKESSSNDFWCQRQIKIQEFDEQFFSIYKILDTILTQSLLFWLQSICRLIFFRNFFKQKSVMLNNTYHTNILKI
jgi:hypothetical protein